MLIWVVNSFTFGSLFYNISEITKMHMVIYESGLKLKLLHSTVYRKKRKEGFISPEIFSSFLLILTQTKPKLKCLL